MVKLQHSMPHKYACHHSQQTNHSVGFAEQKCISSNRESQAEPPRHTLLWRWCLNQRVLPDPLGSTVNRHHWFWPSPSHCWTQHTALLVMSTSASHTTTHRFRLTSSTHWPTPRQTTNPRFGLSVSTLPDASSQLPTPSHTTTCRFQKISGIVKIVWCYFCENPILCLMIWPNGGVLWDVPFKRKLSQYCYASGLHKGLW